MKDSTREMIERSRIDREFYPDARRGFVLARLRERHERNLQVVQLKAIKFPKPKPRIQFLLPDDFSVVKAKIKPMRKFELKMMRVQEVAARLADKKMLTRQNIVDETGFSLRTVIHIIRRLKEENKWDYKYNSKHGQNVDSVIHRVSQVVAENPDIQTWQLVEMFKGENVGERSVREFARLARKQVGVNIRALNRDNIYKNILKVASENLHPDGSVNVKKVSRIMGKSYAHIRGYIREMKKKNLWHYPAHNHGKGLVGKRSDCRYQVHQLMVAKPTIGTKEVCEKLKLDYLSNRARVHQMMMRIERVDKVGWIGPRKKK